MYPNFLILEFPQALREFRGKTCDLHMPTVDMSAALQQIFDALPDYILANDRLACTAIDMGSREGLFENSELSDGEKTQVTLAVNKLGQTIKNTLVSFNLYRDGHFPYSFHEMLNDSTIILRYTPPALPAPGSHHH